MILTVLGSGTVVPHPEFTCAGYHLDLDDLSLLLDCGPGTVHRLAANDIDWTGLTHILLTHFHTDHIGDLPALFFAFKHALREGRDAPLTVLGPAGTRERFERMASAFGDSLRDPGFPLTIRELEGGASVQLGAETRLAAIATPHTDRSLAYRIDTPRASLGYTGDTGYPDHPDHTDHTDHTAGTAERRASGPELARFLHGVDILLAECSLPDAHAMPTHLTPATAAALARAAAPRTLVLSHIYPVLDRDTLPARIREAGWNGRLIIARDGARVLPVA